MKKIVLTCGLIAGAIVTAIMAISISFFDKNHTESSEILGYASMILSFSLIFVGVKIFRDRHNGGSVTFGKAFLIGLYISLIASTIYVVVWALEYKYVFPDFMDNYSACMVSKAKASGASPEKIDAQIKQLAMYRDMYKSPIFFTLMTYAEILPVGLVISLIAALILKKKNKANLSAAN